MVQEIFGGSLRLAETALDVRALRHDLLASNIANAETPGYRALDVDFAATMEAAIKALDPPAGAAAPSRALQEALRVIGADAPSVGNAQNTVDVDQQLSRLEENALMFQITAQLASSRFAQLRRTLEEGGRGIR